MSYKYDAWKEHVFYKSEIFKEHISYKYDVCRTNVLQVWCLTDMKSFKQMSYKYALLQANALCLKVQHVALSAHVFFYS